MSSETGRKRDIFPPPRAAGLAPSPPKPLFLSQGAVLC